MEEALSRAHAHWNAGQADQAELSCQRVLARWPAQADALHLMGLIAHARGNLDVAFKYVRQACLAPGASAIYFSNLAEMCRRKGLLEEAERAGRQAVVLDPALAPAWGNLAVILEVTGRGGEARFCRERAASLQAVAPRRQERMVAGPISPRPGRIRVLAMTVSPDWLGIARLPAALHAAGFDVATLSPRDSFLSLSGFACQRFFPDGEDWEQALTDVVSAWQPSLIIPGDEWCMLYLQHFGRTSRNETLRRLIGDSLGNPAFHPTVCNKRHTLAEAARLGLSVPAEASPEALADFTLRHGYPVMVKAAVGMAGLAVRQCADEAEARAAVEQLRSAPLPPCVAENPVFLQEWMAGDPVSITFVSLQGRLLDGFVYRPEETSANNGPASVCRRVSHPGVEDAARRLVEHFGFTGFGGFDFLVDRVSGEARLLEMNARVPVTGHLGSCFGHDLPAALYAAITGLPPPVATQGHETVVIFPHEWWRDPGSRHLKEHHVDVPWDDVDLLRHFISRQPA